MLIKLKCSYEMKDFADLLSFIVEAKQLMLEPDDFGYYTSYDIDETNVANLTIECHAQTTTEHAKILNLKNSSFLKSSLHYEFIDG